MSCCSATGQELALLDLLLLRAPVMVGQRMLRVRVRILKVVSVRGLCVERHTALHKAYLTALCVSGDPHTSEVKAVCTT